MRIAADQLDEVGDLVDMPPVGGLPVAPLLAVDRPKVAVLVGPFIPNADLALVEPADVGVAAQEPQQLGDDRTQMQLLRGEQREAIPEIEAHLGAEPRQSAGSSAVLLRGPAIEDQLHELKVLAHLPCNLAAVREWSKTVYNLHCG